MEETEKMVMERKTGRGIREDDVVEIDLVRILEEIKHRLLLIVVATLLFGGLMVAYSRYMLIPQYQSSVMLYVFSKETTLTSLADLQIGTQLTEDYQIIITSRPVLEDVIEKLNLNISYRQLRNRISISNPKSTRILIITVQDSDPVMVKDIADQLAETASNYLGDIMELVPPKLIESAEVPVTKSSPNNTRNALMGALVGAFLACVWVALGVILNDAICTEEDVERYLGLSVLASVPNCSDGFGSGEDSAAKKKRRFGRKKKKRKQRKA